MITIPSLSLQGARGFPGTPGLPGIKGHRVSDSTMYVCEKMGAMWAPKWFSQPSTQKVLDCKKTYNLFFKQSSKSFHVEDVEADTKKSLGGKAMTKAFFSEVTNSPLAAHLF